MALYDPEQAGNAAKFLRLDEKTLLEIRNAPFLGKDAVWVPNKEVGYIKGVAQGPGTKPGTRKVKYGKEGKEKDFSEDVVEPQNPPKVNYLIYYIFEREFNYL